MDTADHLPVPDPSEETDGLAEFCRQVLGSITDGVLELRLSKDEILELWLGRVSFGNRTHGIEAAARLYFGKSAYDLSVAESALIAAIIQSPNGISPHRRPE